MIISVSSDGVQCNSKIIEPKFQSTGKHTLSCAIGAVFTSVNLTIRGMRIIDTYGPYPYFS